jgi:hypothetical protein
MHAKHRMREEGWRAGGMERKGFSRGFIGQEKARGHRGREEKRQPTIMPMMAFINGGEM